MAVDAWKNFEMSGKVSDYLAYRQDAKAKSTQNGGGAYRMDETAGFGRGMGSYGTERSSIRDGAACDADWGLR